MEQDCIKRQRRAYPDIVHVATRKGHEFAIEIC